MPDNNTNNNTEFKMKWKNLLSNERQRDTSSSEISNHDGRNAFEKDFHRIILSASFRRLQDKTQVFPLDQSDFVRTRLTHSLEVSSLAKSLGAQTSSMLRDIDSEHAPRREEAKQIADLLLCAGLLHDMGNPPFGHYGESTIRNFYISNLDKLIFKDMPISSYLNQQMKYDLYNFEGNAQIIRIVSKLHYLIDENGMNLTFGLLNALMKYPVDSTNIDNSSEDVRYNKLGYFYSERDLFKQITTATGTRKNANDEAKILNNENNNIDDKRKPHEKDLMQLSFASDSGQEHVVRHPLTYLLEAADDISYRTADLEDASRKGKISFIELKSYLDNSFRQGKVSEDLLAKYREVVDKLDECYEDAKSKHKEKAHLYAIQNWVIYVQSLLIKTVSEVYVDNIDTIMRGEYLGDLFRDNLAGLVLDVLGDIAYDFVFSSQSIVELEVAADAIITGLLEKLVPAAINYDTDIEQNPLDRRLIALISDNYRACYERESEGKSEEEKLYLRLLLVNDYICGMTDSFARDLYYKFNGIY